MKSALSNLMATLLLAALLALPLHAGEPPVNPAPNGSPGASSPSIPSSTYFALGTDSDASEHVSYLGVDPADITADRVAALKLKDERGVEVTMVDEDGPAGKAGMKDHDVILQFDGKQVESVEQLRRMIREVPPGRTVAVSISRAGQPMELQVKLGDRIKDMNHIYVIPPIPPVPPVAPIAPMPPMAVIPNFDTWTYTFGGNLYGMQVESLTPQLGEFFGVKNGDGVLVREVERGSAAATAGLKAGDVILKVEDRRITSRNDFRMALRRHRSGAKVTLGIVRDKREQPLVITLPARAAGSETSGYFSPEFEQKMQEMERSMEKLEQGQAMRDMRQRLNDIHWQQVEQKAMQNAQKAMEKAQKAVKDAQAQAQREQEQ